MLTRDYHGMGDSMKLQTNGFHLAGYAFLLQKFQITGMHHWHTSSVLVSGTRKTRKRNGIIEDMYSPRYWPGDTVADHFEFALKYDGVNLEILSVLFERVSESELAQFIRDKPTGRYSRRLWFFYEYITGRRLPIEDCITGNYVDALDGDFYYTLPKGERSRRHRVVNNLLGAPRYCPIVRKTRVLGAFATLQLQKRSFDMLTSFSPEIVERTSMTLIEREVAAVHAQDRYPLSPESRDRFLELLRESESWTALSLSLLQQMHRKVSGREDAFTEDRRGVLEAMMETHDRLSTRAVAPVVHAAVIASGFLIISPLSSANTMVHRMLLHHILALRQLVHSPIVLPIFSDGKENARHTELRTYRFMDLTEVTEHLALRISTAFEDVLLQELNSLTRYERVKDQLVHIIKMPDRLVDLFIDTCIRNEGVIPQDVKMDSFNFLTPAELSRMEQTVQSIYEKPVSLD